MEKGTQERLGNDSVTQAYQDLAVTQSNLLKPFQPICCVSITIEHSMVVNHRYITSSYTETIENTAASR